MELYETKPEKYPEAIFLVVCDPSINELLATWPMEIYA